MANSFFEITGGTAPGSAGTAMVGLDLNGDGTDDTVVATSDVTVIYGDLDGFDQAVDVSNLTAAAGFTLSGSALGDEFGYVLAKATDLQGTGTGDALLIGARLGDSTTEGTVSVVLNGETTIGFTVTGLPYAANGMSLAGLGDLNGDGFGDFAIGAPDANFGSGAVYVIYGSETPPTTLDVDNLDGSNGFVINGFDQNGFGGTSIAGGFDFDGDGANDLLIGAPGTDINFGGGTNAGATYIVYGTLTPDATPSASESIVATDYRTTVFTGLNAQDMLGTVVSAGDVNGDAFDDVIITAPEADNNSSAAYVILGGATPETSLAALTGSASGGFKITGVDIADVTMLGDVSGDGVGDIGIVASNGDVYIVYGQQGGFADSTFDLTDLTDPNNQPNNLGMVFTGLFGDAVPTSVTLTGLGDVNGDPSGAIGDIGIYATFAGGTQPAQSFTILGGTANFAALDADDGSTDSTIDFAAIDGPVDFVETAPTVVFFGDAAVTIDEDTASVSQSIGITDSAATGPVQFVRDDPIQGIYGIFVLNDAGSLWTYTVDADQVAVLNALGVGESFQDTATFVANNPAQTRREITITIDGVDDVGTVEVLLDGPATEDSGRITGTVTLNDPDTSDNPTLANATGAGSYGNIVVDENGRFTYTVTDASLQSLGDVETREETITLTGDDGLSYDFVLEITGATEGIPLNFDDNENTIYTSFGNDIINAFGGNDFINAGAGNDTVDAGNGDDTVFDVLGDDNVDGGIGNDDIRLLTGDNIVEGRDGNDFIVTGFGFDTINGGDGDDVIAADAGGVFLFGNNQITGGAGSDHMMGGAGRDTFVFNQLEAVDGDVDTIGAFDIDEVTRSNGDLDVISNGASFQFGVDQIVLLGFTTVNANNVMDFVTPQGGLSRFEAEGTVIDFINVQIAPEDSTAGLQASDFLFALA